jgi:hypothetical protein
MDERPRWWIPFLVGGALVVLVGLLVWGAQGRRHRASTYGITDPSLAALRIENETTDYAITHISIEDSEQHVVSWEETIEIEPGENTVISLEPGNHIVRLRYVEVKQAEAHRPKGTLDQPVAVSAGEAVLLSLEGGRSSPGASIVVAPRVVAK